MEKIMTKEEILQQLSYAKDVVKDVIKMEAMLNVLMEDLQIDAQHGIHFQKIKSASIERVSKIRILLANLEVSK